MTEEVTMNEVRTTINHLVQGVDPYTGEVLEEVAFMQNPRLIRCFALMSELLTRAIEAPTHVKGRKSFRITDEEVERIEFPQGDIGIKRLLDAVNTSIDSVRVKYLTVQTLYKRLKAIGVLADAPDGTHVKTTIGPEGEDFGIVLTSYTYQGATYDRVMYTDRAKDNIKDRLSEWFPVD